MRCLAACHRGPSDPMLTGRTTFPMEGGSVTFDDLRIRARPGQYFVRFNATFHDMVGAWA